MQPLRNFSFVLPSEEERKITLAKLLLRLSYREGDFTLTSGRKSSYYFDCKPTALHPEGGVLIASFFMDMLGSDFHDVHAVAGMTLGADPLISATSLLSFFMDRPLPGIIVRKQSKGHGTNQFLEGTANLQPGANVVMLEDVVTTGGTLLTAIERVQNGGFHISGVLAVLDRQEGGRQNLADAGFGLQSIFTVEELKTYKDS